MKPLNGETPVHTEQMQDIIGTPPIWLYRWGITMILAIAIICVIIASFIDYPQLIQTHLKICSVNEPAKISINTPISIIRIVADNNHAVKKGDSLAIIQSDKGYTVVTAPFSGELNYCGIIHENMRLNADVPIFTIADSQRDYFGEIPIPQSGISKIRPGQKVLVSTNIINNGKQQMLQGTIRYITDGPAAAQDYIAEVDFNRSNRNQFAIFRQGMVYNAQIVVADATLLRRLIQSLTKE